MGCSFQFNFIQTEILLSEGLHFQREVRVEMRLPVKKKEIRRKIATFIVFLARNKIREVFLTILTYLILSNIQVTPKILSKFYE